MTDQSNAVMVRARTTTAVAPRAAEADAALDVVMRRAQAIARAGDAIPKGYRQNPGAVLLALEWATQREVDALTAIQTVSFISGRPVIDATMQRALAKRAGYRVRPKGEPTTETATVEVWEDGELLGSATYTIEEARSAGLTGKDNWKHNPKDMLIARATTRAMRWWAPDVMVGVFTADELDDGDALEVLVPTEADPEPIDEAEVVEVVALDESDHPPVTGDFPDDGTPLSDDTARAVRAAIAHAKAAQMWPDVATQMQAEGIPLAVPKMTEAQALRVAWLCRGEEVES